MNAAQRRILVRALFAIAAVCTTWVLLVVGAYVIGDSIPHWASASLGRTTLAGFVSLVTALYLLAGGKSE